jgi:hypothetical protein
VCAAGKVLRHWGAGCFLMPHMITVDRSNSVWVTDVGLHQALQFSADGKLLRAVGRAKAPGSDKHSLCKPTQVRGAAPTLRGWCAADMHAARCCPPCCCCAQPRRSLRLLCMCAPPARAGGAAE